MPVVRKKNKLPIVITHLGGLCCHNGKFVCRPVKLGQLLTDNQNFWVFFFFFFLNFF
jgi:hypothetical protein